MVDDIIDELKTELSKTDARFDEDLLTVKVNGAYREVKSRRCYPSSYTSTMMARDMENYYSNVRNIALYDYNSIGAEFQKESTESDESRKWVDRTKLFAGVIPIAKM